MTGLLAALLAAVAIVSPVTARSEVLPEARPVLEKLERAIEPLTSFEAGFVQVRHLALTDEKVEAIGRMRFLAPDFFRLDYKSPDPDVLTMAGDSMMVYFQALKQAQRYEVDEKEATRSMFLLFSSRRGTIEKEFDVSLGPPSPEGRALRLQPLGDAIDYPITEIQVHLGRTGLPERLTFREQGGDVVLFQLKDTRTNRKLKAADFVFVPPRGTEIIDR